MIRKFIKCILILLAASTSEISASSTDTAWKNFVTPPDSTRTKLWWFHGETETTAEGIDADLEAFKAQGIGGVVFYDQVHGQCSGAFPSMSAPWWQMLKHAALKARSLGLTFEVAASNGYVAGGPWITPRLGMKRTEIVDTVIFSQGGKASLELPTPKHFCEIATVAFPTLPDFGKISLSRGRITVTGNDTIITYNNGHPVTVRGISYSMLPRGKGSTSSMNVPCTPTDRYCGAKYIDYPPVGVLEYSPDGKTWHKAADLLPIENAIGHKSRRRSISFPPVTGNYFRLNICDWMGPDRTYKSLWIEDINLFTVDIIDNVEVKNGLRTEITYPAPVGENYGAVDRSSVINLTGLDSCSLSGGYWHIIKMGYVPTGAKTKHGRSNLLGLEADVMSSEAAAVHFRNYFKPICDTLATIGAKPLGMCMDSHEAGTQNWTEGFDSALENRLGISFYQWVPAFAGYIVDNRAKTEVFLDGFREAVADAITNNFYGTLSRLCRENGVDFTSQAMLNIACDNIASRGRAAKPQGEFWTYQTNGNYDCLDAASAAHIYGHPIASAEAFTDTPYSTPLDSLLMIANIAYCRGINEFVVCASSYQPWPDRKYDDSSTLHPYVFHRHNPMWADMRPFWDYQARCAYMLRQGTPIVDLCVYAGDDFPVKTVAFRLPPIPEGFNFDIVNREALSSIMDVDSNGDIVTGGDVRYKALIIKKSDVLCDAAEKNIARLQANGARIIRCDKGEDVESRLKDLAIEPDMYIRSAGLPDDKVLFFHRKCTDFDVYFVYNHSNSTYCEPISLRNQADEFEIWDPATAKRRKSSQSEPLTLVPHQALFLISPHNADITRRSISFVPCPLSLSKSVVLCPLSFVPIQNLSFVLFINKGLTPQQPPTISSGTQRAMSAICVANCSGVMR